MYEFTTEVGTKEIEFLNYFGTLSDLHLYKFCDETSLFDVAVERLIGNFFLFDVFDWHMFFFC